MGSTEPESMFQALRAQTEKTPLDILRSNFGYENFRGSQEKIVRQLSEGGDALVLMPTGGGKSLCYQIPALIRPGTGIIVSPLIALMQDQVDNLRQLGIKAGFINSSQETQEREETFADLRAGRLDLLYVAPERLLMESFLSFLGRVQIALFAIDEAHCVSQWGHDFRPEYMGLHVLAEKFPGIPRIALTATADEVTRQEIVARLRLENAARFVAGFDRPNIAYSVALKDSPRTQLMDFLAEHRDNAGIVYCLSRKKTEETAKFLIKEGYNALPYHAGLDQNLRQEHQRRFLREDGVIIVATIAFGMGIDKPDVRFVVHMDLPKSMESYYQETGRAGRDGKPAEALTLYNLADVMNLRQMLDSSDGTEEYKMLQRKRLDHLLGFCETLRCRRQVLLEYFGDKLEEPCGNCDTCLSPPESWDGTIAAQKALSCVYRTGQMFGAGYLIDVLLGKSNERIVKFGHESISTFGIGGELDAREWKSVFRQIAALGYLEADMGGKGGFRLSESSRQVLKGETTVLLRKDPKAKRVARTNGGDAAERERSREEFFESLDENDRQLWEKLRATRTDLARDRDLAPYMIFHDSTLREMMEQRPQELTHLAGISGVGQKKLDLYGQAFLDVIRTHRG